MPSSRICYEAVDRFRERGVINPDSGEKAQLFNFISDTSEAGSLM